MVRDKSHNKTVLFGLAIVATILVYAQEKPEPKLLWQRQFNERVGELTLTHDGGLILVNASNKRYLLNGKDGKIIRSFKEENRLFDWVLTGDGRMITHGRGEIMNINGTIIGRGEWAKKDESGQYIPPVTEWRYPVYSPSNKYMAYQGATEAEGEPFIEMYDLETGKLLWEYKPFETGAEPDTWGGFRIKFVDDERLAVYEGRQVRMLKVKTGEKIWETEIFRGIRSTIAYDVDLHMVVNDSGDICIAKWCPGFVVSVSRDGKLRWEKNLGGIYAGTMALSSSGRFLSIITKSQMGYPTYLSLIDNLSGNVIWQRVSPFFISSEEGKTYFIDDEYLFRCGEAIEEDLNRGRFLYLWDVRTGNLVWKWKPEDGNANFMRLSQDKKRLLIIGGKNTVYLFDVSKLGGGGK